MPPIVSALKGIKFLFAGCKKGLDTECKIQKIRENKRVLHVVVTFLQLAKGSLIAFWAAAKGNQIPFRANCMLNLRIACNADNVSNIPLGELNLKINPILHTWFRDSCFTCDGSSTIRVFPLLFHIVMVI